LKLTDNHAGNSSRVLRSSFTEDDNESSVEEPAVASVDTIKFQRTFCTISTDTGHYSFSELSTIEIGLLDQKTMFLSTADRGKTKDVYGASHTSPHF
jgi:hypothetical protein